jgi:hypothetical protein
MALARRWGGVITVAVAVAIGAALYTGVGRDPEGSGTGREAPPLGAVPGVMPLAGAAKCTPSEPAAALWFAFVAQIFVSEFFNYHPVVGWLNQPLVHLPWFRYIPAGLGG